MYTIICGRAAPVPALIVLDRLMPAFELHEFSWTELDGNRSTMSGRIVTTAPILKRTSVSGSAI
jgi:hypothetical protein